MKASDTDILTEVLAGTPAYAERLAKVPLAGTEYIPGVTEQRTLEDLKTMMEKYLADTGQLGT